MECRLSTFLCEGRQGEHKGEIVMIMWYKLLFISFTNNLEVPFQLTWEVVTRFYTTDGMSKAIRVGNTCASSLGCMRLVTRSFI